MNYYDVLEVSEKASKEIIEKAYRTLAKKYHPDLQTPENRASAENKMKLLNEAYEILSDENKRNGYDEKLKKIREEVKIKEVQSRLQDKREIDKLLNIIKQKENNQPSGSENIVNNFDNYKEKINNYIRYVKNPANNYEQMYVEETWIKQFIKSKMRKLKEFVLTILIMIGIFIVIWIFPPTHNILVQIYEENPIIRGLVDMIFSLF